jgi:xylose dehydrogenase (NAD/NADP)
MNKKVKWGVLGFARIAKNEVIPAILKNDNSQFFAIASRDKEKAEECSRAFNCSKTYYSYEALLDDPEIDAVYIPLPNSMHKEWAIKAMQQGKHVLCEKPISLDSIECELMIETSVKHNRILMEAFMYRYTDRISKVSSILSSNSIGEIKQINSTFRFFLDRPSDIRILPEFGGGSLYDVGSYPVNFISMIMKSLPVAYTAQSIKESNVDVLFSGILKYQNGVIATLNSGFNAFKEMHSEIIGTKGIIEIPDTFAGTKGVIRVITSDDQKEIAVEESDRYYLEIKNFANAVLNKECNLLSLEESLRNMRVIEQLLRLI